MEGLILSGLRTAGYIHSQLLPVVLERFNWRGQEIISPTTYYPHLWHVTHTPYHTRNMRYTPRTTEHTSVTCVSHRTPHRLWEWEVWTLWSLVRLKSLKDKEEVSSASKRDSSDNPIVVSGQPSHPPLIWCLYRVWQVSIPHKYLFISAKMYIIKYRYIWCHC